MAWREKARIESRLKRLANGNLVGKNFGRLRVVSEQVTPSIYRYWLCHCECGNDKVIRGTSLKNGNTKSCGCLMRVKRERKVNSAAALCSALGYITKEI
jgi:hypothetical protein